MWLSSPTHLVANLSAPRSLQMASPDQEFMSFREHLKKVGEDEALLDLRMGFFPISLKRTMWAKRGTPNETMTDDLARFYCVSDDRRIRWGKMLPAAPWRITNCLMFFKVRKNSQPIKHWWLFGSRTPDMRARLWIVHLSTDNSPEYLESACMLSKQIRDRMHAHRKSMFYCNDAWPQTVQLVNREITASIRAIS